MAQTRKPIKGVVLPIDGPSEEREFTGLDSMQQVVGGLIEPVELKDGSTIYVNEEGLIYDLPVNYFASDVAGLGGRVDVLMLGLRGPAFVVGPIDDEGYDTDITDQARRWIRRVERERV